MGYCHIRDEEIFLSDEWALGHATPRLERRAVDGADRSSYQMVPRHL